MVQTTVREIVIGALVLTAILTGIFSMIGLALPDNSGNFSDYNRSYNKFNIIKQQTQNITDSTENARPAEGVEGIVSGLFSSSFGALRNVWSSITTLKTVIEDTSNGGSPISLPWWLTSLFVSIITVTVAFALISSWRKWYT